MTIRVGQAFLIPSGTAYNPSVKHMFVVCTDIDQSGRVVLAPISSWKNDLCDATCRLAPGCHPFIKKDSYVLYRYCRIEDADTLQRGLDAAVFIQLDAVSSTILGQIVDGISQSKQTPWVVKRHIKRLSPPTDF